MFRIRKILSPLNPLRPYIQGYFMLSLLEISPVVLEKVSFCQSIFAILFISLLEKVILPLRNLNPFTHKCFVLILVKIGPGQ